MSMTKQVDQIRIDQKKTKNRRKAMPEKEKKQEKQAEEKKYTLEEFFNEFGVRKDNQGNIVKQDRGGSKMKVNKLLNMLKESNPVVIKDVELNAVFGLNITVDSLRDNGTYQNMLRKRLENGLKKHKIIVLKKKKDNQVIYGFLKVEQNG